MYCIAEGGKQPSRTALGDGCSVMLATGTHIMTGTERTQVPLMEVDGTLKLNVAQWQMGMTFNYCSTPFTPQIPHWPKMEKKGHIIYLIQFHNRWSILNPVYYLIQLQDLNIYWFMIIVDFFPSNQFKRKMHQSHNIKRIALQTMGYPIIQARFLDLRSLKITDCEISKTCVPNTSDLTMVERGFF